jgi:hypothetical protein
MKSTKVMRVMQRERGYHLPPGWLFAPDPSMRCACQEQEEIVISPR